MLELLVDLKFAHLYLIVFMIGALIKAKNDGENFPTKSFYAVLLGGGFAGIIVMNLLDSFVIGAYNPAIVALVFFVILSFIFSKMGTRTLRNSTFVLVLFSVFALIYGIYLLMYFSNVVDFYIAVVLLFSAISLICAKVCRWKFSSKLFYILLFSGFTIISTICAMRVGYINFGDKESLLLLSAREQQIIGYFIPGLYAIILAIIFNLDSMKKNIIKIVVVSCLLPASLVLSIFGIFLGMHGETANIAVIICSAVVFLALVILRVLRRNKFRINANIIIDGLIALAVTVAVIFSANLYFQINYVFSNRELKELANQYKTDLDFAIGENQWEIVKGRRGIMPSYPEDYKSSMVWLSYETKEGKIERKCELPEKEAYGYEITLMDNLYMDKISEVRNELQKQVEETYLNKTGKTLLFKIEIGLNNVPTMEDYRKYDLTLDNFSTEKFLETGYVVARYYPDVVSYELVKEIVDEKIGIIEYEYEYDASYYDSYGDEEL